MASKNDLAEMVSCLDVHGVCVPNGFANTARPVSIHLPWLMCEIPVNALRAKDFLALFDGFSIPAISRN